MDVIGRYGMQLGATKGHPVGGLYGYLVGVDNGMVSGRLSKAGSGSIL